MPGKGENKRKIIESISRHLQRCAAPQHRHETHHRASLTNEGGLEEGLGASEAFVADGDDLAVGKLVGLFERG